MIDTYFFIGFVGVLILLVLLITAFQFVFLLDVVFGEHDFTTTRAGIEKVSDILRQFNKDKAVLYDLGSCRGDFILGLLKKCPSLQAYGIDNSRLRTWLAKILSWFLNRPANFITADIFDYVLSRADSVYIYLDQSLMPALQTKLQKELKPGALVIIHSVSFPSWPPVEEHSLENDTARIKKLFVYVKN